MKNAYLITFESNVALTTILKIKRLGVWAKINNNCFIIVSELTTSGIRDALYTNNADITKAFVINITNKGWASYGLSKEVTDWLKDNLRQ